ncbi:phage head-tail connector protein [Alkalihalobacterium alkalinitrilicum]|uniref:phage head-tail connector protein n=1 Tax=Alkalihalobacterium alkalinitrilicum TaxID=427920 RepID=UPI00099504CB|nr:phage head-tail connector protein [Alkalihalobacterium alkalinitrilicum]
MNDQQLLVELKDRLQITWSEEDNHLIGIIQRAKAYLSGLTSASFNYEVEGVPKELLLERCRYVYNNVGDEFERNFAHELKRLILHVALGKVGVIDESISGDV